ncbi:MAG: ImmA/IrrE family metallo-endopeptidase [Candidatus Eisenbacteria sp.]|nr:ImmA/IrrE family metallo-endopeptidase [Candidatus Eisenbacteria bacterium]
MESRYPTDSNGVPVLNRKDVEEEAENLLCFHDESLIEAPREVPVLSICDRLEREYDVRFNYDVDLNTKVHGGRTILGKCLPDELTVYVDTSLRADDNIFTFTLAHELGHLVIHQGLELKTPLPPDDQEVIERDYVTGRKILVTAVDWLEWQANRFASALLMPRSTFQLAISQQQTEMGITRNVGFVHVDREGYSLTDFEHLKSGISAFFRVSKTAVEYRMNDLGILHDRRYRNMKHISELFRRR